MAQLSCGAGASHLSRVLLVVAFLAITPVLFSISSSTVYGADTETTTSGAVTAASISMTISHATGGSDTSADIAFNTPSDGGLATGRHLITIASNSVSGYSVIVSNASSSSTDLINSSDATKKITATTGTVAKPSTLSTGEWGIAIPGKDSFDAETSYNTDDQTTLAAAKFAGVPAKNANSDIQVMTSKTTSASSGDTQYVYYGANVAQLQLAGTYSTTVQYTATATLPPAPTITSVSPDTVSVGQNDITVTIEGTGFDSAISAYIDLDGDGSVDSGETCSDLNIISSTKLTCTLDTSYTGTTITKANVYVEGQGGTSSISDNAKFSYINSICMNANDGSDCQVDIDDNMIPITYAGSTSEAKWVKADTTKAGDWYNYTEKKWANAVTVTSSSLDTYKSAAAGTEIDEDDVLGYWVYIPRYAYEVQRLNATDRVVDAQNFAIVFEKASDAKETPVASCNSTTQTLATMWANGTATASATSTNSNILVKDYRTGCGLNRTYPDGDSTIAGATTWATHPAFTYGDTELNGFWIGKYEMTGSLGSPTIKPNLVSNISNRTGDYYSSIKAMGVLDSDNTAGYTSSYTQNSHNLSTANTSQLKNDQWGAATYLSASEYGAGTKSGTGNDAGSKVYNNASVFGIYTDANGKYQVRKDGDGNQAEYCYYSFYYWNGSSVASTTKYMGTCLTSSGTDGVLTSSGTTTSNGATLTNATSSDGTAVAKTVSYTYQTDSAGTTKTATAGITHYSGAYTGYGPANASTTYSWDRLYTCAGSKTLGNVNSVNDSCENTAYSYQSTNGQLASTTGNTYGVYDMAAGEWEYVAANTSNVANTTCFTSMTGNCQYIGTAPSTSNASKYFNLYYTSAAGGTFNSKPAWAVNSSEQYRYNFDNCTWTSCGGQAMHETRRYQSVNAWDDGWGADGSDFPYSSAPWLIRGGYTNCGGYAGLFASSNTYGGGRVDISSRAALRLMSSQ